MLTFDFIINKILSDYWYQHTHVGQSKNTGESGKQLLFLLNPFRFDKLEKLEK